MSLGRHDKHIKAFACLDQFINNTHRVGRMDVIVYLAMDEQQMSAHVFCQFLVEGHFDVENGFIVFCSRFLHSVMFFTP